MHSDTIVLDIDTNEQMNQEQWSQLARLKLQEIVIEQRRLYEALDVLTEQHHQGKDLETVTSLSNYIYLRLAVLEDKLDKYYKIAYK